MQKEYDRCLDMRYINEEKYIWLIALSSVLAIVCFVLAIIVASIYMAGMNIFSVLIIFLMEKLSDVKDRNRQIYQARRKHMNNNERQKRPEISVADEIAGYKKLLDSGAITQEEYEQKKKRLLNL